MNRRRPLIAAALMAGLALPAMAGAAPDPHETAARVRIEIDTSALPQDDYEASTRRWVTDNQTAVLEAAGFVVSDDAAHVIRIEISRYGEFGVHTKARIMLVGDEDSVLEFSCEMCGESQFLEKVDEHTTLVAQRLQSSLAEGGEPARESEPEPRPRGEAEDEGSGSVTDENPVDASGRRLGGLGYAGISSAVLGLGLTLGGVIVLAEDPLVELQPQDMHVFERTSRRPLGVGLTVAGASLLAVGAVLVIVDQTKMHKKRSRRGAKATLAPSLSPASAGLAIVGRF